MPPGSYPREASIIWSKRVNKSLSNYSFNRISESRSICSVQLSCQIVCVYYEILTKVTLFYRRPGGKWEISSFLYIQGDPFSKCESGSKLFLSLTCWELERKRKARIIFPCPFIFFSLIRENTLIIFFTRLHFLFFHVWNGEEKK